MTTNEPQAVPFQEPAAPPSSDNRLVIFLLVIFGFTVLASAVVIGWYLVSKNSNNGNLTGSPAVTVTPTGSAVLLSVTKGTVTLNRVDVGEPSGTPFGIQLIIDGKVQQAAEFNYCNAAELSDNGQYLVTRCRDTGKDATLWAFNASSNTFLRVGDYDLPLRQSGQVNLHTYLAPLISVANDGTHFAYASFYGDETSHPVYLEIYSVATRTAAQVLLTDADYSCGSTDCPPKPVISPDNKYVAIQESGNQQIAVFDLRGQLIKTIDTGLTATPPESTDAVWSLILDYHWDGSSLLYGYYGAAANTFTSVVVP
jgi:hypothetical protein